MPLPELLLQILGVLEAAHLEEGSLHETHQIFHRPLLLSPVRPTEFHPDAHLQGGAGEDRIPFRHLPVPPPLQRHRLRPVEHAHQPSPSPTVQMLCQAPHQALHGLILHHRDAHPARVLQARGKQADAARRPIDKLDVHLPEVVLAEFSRQTLKTNQGLDLLRPPGGHQGVKCALAPRVARSPNSPQDFTDGRSAFSCRISTTGFRKFSTMLGRPILRCPRSAVSSTWTTGSSSAIRLFRDTLDGAQRNSRQTGHLDLRVASLQQDFDLVSLQHP